MGAAGYWVGQLMALLQVHGVAENTAVIITGSVGQELREHGGTGDGHALVPEVLQVPLVVWHPRLAASQGSGRLIEGGDLAGVGATALALAGAPVPEAWPVEDLSAALFAGLPVPPQPSHARLKNQVAARFGGWLLRGHGSRDLKLWDLVDDPTAREEVSSDRPVALRTLRDSMLD